MGIIRKIASYKSVAILVKTYLLSLSVFSFFRVLLFLSENNRVDFSEDFGTLVQAFIMGTRFDVVITGYIMLLPALFIIILDFIKPKNTLAYSIIRHFIFTLFCLAFFMCTVDVPYFKQFFSRLSVGALEWLENSDVVVNMIVQEPAYFLFSIPLIAAIVLFQKGLKKIFSIEAPSEKANLFVKIPVSLLLLTFICIGIRGRLEQKSPIRVGTAYFSNHAFLNQLGLNPVFTFIRSYLDTKQQENKTLQLMPDLEAVAYVQKSLNISGNSTFSSPIARQVSGNDSLPLVKPNIVLVIMESMSAAKMSRHGNPNNLTPFLDSLSQQSLYFENIYTAGKHTFNGVFGSLFSFPALYRKHPLKQIATYNGMASELKKHDYSTAYFTTHDGQFDNIEGFLKANSFEEVISQANYPPEEVKTALGVPDDFMFRFSIDKLNELHKKGKPFFSAFMTASDHGPYFVPEYFKPKTSEIKQQIVEYADWSLQQFLNLSKQQPWYDNTLFIFIADHGAAMSGDYPISLDFHHSPLIYFSPSLLDSAQVQSNIGGQIDLFPTTMGLLNLPYLNNTLGIDLLKETRPYIIINDDDKVGVLDTTHLLILNAETKPSLYNYSTNSKEDLSTEMPEKTLEMETYAKANMQTFQYLLKSNKTFVE